MVRCKKICTSLKKGKIYTNEKFCITKHIGLKFICLLGHNYLNLLPKNFFYTMFLSSLKWSNVSLTDNKKLMIINVHNYLLKANFTEKSLLKLKLRKQVAEAQMWLRVQLEVLYLTGISAVLVHLHHEKSIK